MKNDPVYNDIHDQYAHYCISILTVCISSWTVRNRSLCTKFIIYAIILYWDQIVRRSFFMAPSYNICTIAITCNFVEYFRSRRLASDVPKVKQKISFKWLKADLGVLSNLLLFRFLWEISILWPFSKSPTYQKENAQKLILTSAR